MNQKAKPPFVSLNVAVLTVLDTRTRENDTSGDLIQERVRGTQPGELRVVGA